MKNLKIDQFYLIFLGSLIVLALAVIFTLRVSFSSVEVASQIDEGLLSSQTPRLQKDKIEKALSSLSTKKIVPLDLNP